MLAAALSSKRGVWRGRLVRSMAGRDRDRVYYVLADSEDGFVWVADGRKRPVEAPKRKNVRHLQEVPISWKELQAVAADRLPAPDGDRVRNEEVRTAINTMLKVKEGE